jgi:hypothetical protein
MAEYIDDFQRRAKNAIPGIVGPSTIPELTREEERLFGVYVNPTGQIVPGVRPAGEPVPGAKPIVPVAPVAPVAPTQTNEQTNQIYILVNKLKSVGIPAATADRAGVFFASLLDDGITNEDNAVDIFLNTKSYKSKKTGQEIPSPYYADFGKFNDGLSSAKPPGVLVPLVLGLRETLKKYNPGSLYETDDAMQKYLKNDVKVSELDERLNAARLRSITADKSYVDSLIKLNYISKAEDLTGFFASPEMGQKQLELNRNTGAFAAEALRRAKTGGIQLDTEFSKQQAARLTAEGYSEGQIANEASRAFARINRDIMPTVKVSGIYQGAQAASAATVQSGLQQEEFMNMNYDIFDTLAAQESASFRGSTDFLNRTSLKSETIGQQ